MTTRTLVITLTESKPIEGLADKIGGRVYTIDGVDQSKPLLVTEEENCLIAAAPELNALANNFEISGPDDDGLLWLVLNGNGTTGKAMFNLGSVNRIAGQVAQHLEADRRAAIAKATGSTT